MSDHAVPEPRLSLDEQRAWRAFLGAHARTTLALDRELHRTARLRLGDFDVLSHLAEAGGTMRMNQLAERCSLSPSGLTRRFDVLATRGWVERRTCLDDGRGILALLTPDGRAALDAARPAHAAALRRLFLEAVDPATVRLLGEALSTIEARATRAAPDGSTPEVVPTLDGTLDGPP